MADELHLYADAHGEYRWSYVSSNGRILGDSGEGYGRVREALDGFGRLAGVEVKPLDTDRDKAAHECDRHNVLCWRWAVEHDEDGPRLK